jgi:hypothetical protein
MKKITLVLLTVLATHHFCFSQANLLVEAPNANSTTQVRAPNGLSTYAYLRACALVLQSELTNIPSGTTLSMFGFTLSTGTSITSVAGNFTVYLQNTTDVAYLKGTSWSSITTGMTNVYASVMTIPLSATTTSIVLTLSTPFVYNGGGLYVAYDWQSTGPFAGTAATYYAEGTALNPGCASANATGSAPTTLGTTAFRPCFLFGFNNPFSNDVQVVGLESPGRIPLSLNSPYSVKAWVKNAGNTTLNNVAVNLNITGVNPFTDNQVVSSLAPGASSMVTFAPFTPVSPGVQNVSVSVAPDQNNTNNSLTHAQNVNCNIFGYNPGGGNFTDNAVGFGNGTGILATPFTNPVTSTLTGLRGAISTDPASVNQYVYGVLMNSTGVILATTNTLQITTPIQGTFVNFNFGTAQNLTPGTVYYLGLAQMAATTATFYPAGTQNSSYNPNLYYSSGLAGGTLTQITQNFGYFGLEAVFINTVTVSAASQTVSCGSPATLQAVSATNYSWNTGATTSSITVSPTVTTQYSVTATNTMGCASTATLNLQVNPLTLSVTASSQFVPCGSSATLSASGSSTYTWSTGPNASSIVVTPTANTTYTVSTSNGAGCSSSTNIAVHVNSISISASASPTSPCSGDPVTLSASGASSYTWSTTNTTVTGPSLTDHPTAFTVYSVTAANPDGCSTSSFVLVNVSPSPSLSVNSNTTGVCSGKSVTLSVSGSVVSYTWSHGPSTASIVETPLQTTTYSVSGSNAAGCSTGGTVQITVNSFTPGISSPTTICSGEQVSLSGTGGAANSYSWSNSSTGANITVSPTLTMEYTVTAIGLNGCEGANSTTVTVNATPELSVAAQRTLMCRGESNTVTASGADSYVWSSGDTGPLLVLTPSVTGIQSYTVTGSSQAGCTHTVLVRINVSGCTSVDEIGHALLAALFPNPNTGVLTLSVTGAERYSSVKIYNALGSLVKEQNLSGEQTRLDIQDEAQGIYFVYLVENNTPVFVSKFIKQ